MRRAFVLLVTIMILALALFVPVARTAKGQAEPLPKLTTTVYAGAGGALIFVPAQILIPQVPIILNITVINNGTTGLHTFSINDQNPDLQIDVSVVSQGDRGSVEFQVNESDLARGAIGEIYYNGSSFSPELASGGIRFYCIPHVGLGMVGSIVLASAGTPAAEKGFFLRAYWIGVIGIVAMLGWVGITYFVIKSSSRHFTDHHEHIRRGLP